MKQFDTAVKLALKALGFSDDEIDELAKKQKSLSIDAGGDGWLIKEKRDADRLAVLEQAVAGLLGVLKGTQAYLSDDQARLVDVSEKALRDTTSIKATQKSIEKRLLPEIEAGFDAAYRSLVAAGSLERQRAKMAHHKGPHLHSSLSWLDIGGMADVN